MPQNGQAGRLKIFLPVALVLMAVSLPGFHPEIILLPNLCVKRLFRLGDVLPYVSAQAVVFLDLKQNASFPAWKLRKGSCGISGWPLLKFSAYFAGPGKSIVMHEPEGHVFAVIEGPFCPDPDPMA
jgi:hypothetical protein